MMQYWQSQNQLPPGYRRVEYLESTGNQWIDTGVVPAGKAISAVADFKLAALPPGPSTYGVIGSNKTDGTDNIQLSIYLNKWRVKLNSYATFGTASDLDRHLVSLNISSGTSLDDIVYTSTQYTINSGNTNSMWLFKVQYASNELSSSCRFYSCKIYDNSVLVRSYVPCVRISDNKPGLYELCGSICSLTASPFYINSGTGADFIWGELQ
jgi:hypothetical protein